MSDLEATLREHYESIAPPTDIDRLADRLLTEERLRSVSNRPQGILVAIVAAIVVLVLVGGVALLNLLRPIDVIDEPLPTTVTPLPEVGLPFTVLDREGDVGSGASVILRSDGIPLVAYVFHPTAEGAVSEIRLATCTDAACSAPGDVVTIAEIHEAPGLPEERVPVAVEIATLLPDDGLPIVIWSEWDRAEDGGESYLKAYKCSDPACSSGALADIDARSSSGLWAAAGPDSLPVIAWRSGDWNNTTIHLLKCSDPACSGEYDTSVVDIPRIGWGLVVTTDDGGLPVIAVALKGEDEGFTSLGVARCTDPLCRERPVVTDLGLPVRELSAVEVDADGNPVILAAAPAQDDPGGADQIVLVACTDLTCSATPAVTTIIDSSTAGGDTDPFGSLALTDDGAVTVVNTSGGAVLVATCADPTCEAGPTVVSVLPDLNWPEVDLALAPNGNPTIAIHTNTDLGMFVCTDPTCASSRVEPISDVPGPDWVVSTVASGDGELSGANPSIEIGFDGNPVVAYLGLGSERGPGGERLAAPKLLFCADAGCTSSNVVQVADSGSSPVMALRPDGTPIAVYSDWGQDNSELFIVWCSDTGCADWATEKLGVGGFFTPAAVVAGSDGSVVVAYQDLDDFYVNMVTCTGGSCVDTEPIRIDSLVEDNGTEWGLRWYMNSLTVALLPDGRPVIAAAQANNELRYVECLDATCSQSAVTVIDDQTLDSMTATIAIGPDGLPVLAYYDDGELTVAACHDTGCTDRTTTAVGEAVATHISSITPSMTFSAGGLPMVSYWAPRALMIAGCHDATCTSADVSPFAAVRAYDLAVLPNGAPVMAYFALSEEVPQPGDYEFGPPVDLRVAVCTAGKCVED